MFNENYLIESPHRTLTSKEYLFNGKWPVPQEVEGLGVFSKIKDIEFFDKIVGDPNNWNQILNRHDLLQKWILPYAVLHFGKTWFDRVKYRDSIVKGISLPLFNEEEKKFIIEDTSSGRARIAKIVEKVANVLYIYLKNKRYNKKPSNYILSSLKNEFIKEIGTNMGYKTKNMFACPYCLSSKPSCKVLIEKFTSKEYSCPRCKYIVNSLKISNNPKTFNIIEKRRKFKQFIGITCICPSDKCSGKFVPLSCADENIYPIIKNLSVCGLNSIIEPPESLLDLHLLCPYCETSFTPREAIKEKSGFKNKSGFLTGLPYIKVLIKQEDVCFDENDIDIVAKSDYLDNKILIKQHLNIISGELIIKMSNINKNTTNDLLSWYFLLSVINWIYKYGTDANNYFFNWKDNKDTKGSNAVHQTIFYEWVDLLDRNINEFSRFGIKSLKDFEWLARCPKFTGGPISWFSSNVNDYEIINRTSIKKRKSKETPRLVKILKIVKDDVDFIKDVDSIGWNYIKLKRNTKLQDGDSVNVKALVMSGHPTHAPIQRILRLRMSLSNVIEKILFEEKTGFSDREFWNFWRNRLKIARKKVNISLPWE